MFPFQNKSYLMHSFPEATFEVNRASFVDSDDTAVKRVGNKKGRKLLPAALHTKGETRATNAKTE